MDSTDLLYKLMELEDKLWEFRLSRTKGVYLSIKEIQDIMRKNEPMPTAIFSAKKIDYIVKPRNIYGPKLVKTKKRFKINK